MIAPFYPLHPAPTNPTPEAADGDGISDLIERIARETGSLDNRAAWQEIHARLRAAGVPKRQTATLRDAIWFERRRQSALRQHQSEGKQP